MIKHLLSLKAPAARGDAESAIIKVLERDPNADRRSTAVIQALSQTKDVEGRRSLIALLPACGDDRALAAVKAERASTDATLRDAALRALADWPDAAAVDALLTEAEHATQNNERALALRAAARLLRQSNAAAPGIKAQFEKAMAMARDANEKKLVISALAGSQHEFALHMLPSQLDDPAVRAEAVQAAIALSQRLYKAFPETTKTLLQKLSNMPVEPSVKKSAADLLEVMATNPG
jgi:hypothetical protein